jgi:thiamine transport system permease protein
VNIGLNTLGLPNVQIFGIHGVILAHVFFNLPLATRLILQGWTAIPAEHFRLAASMDFKSWQIFRVLEWPMLRSVLPGAFMVIFLICTTSFAVALALGGGPRATTVELAIYQAFRLEFDLSKAAQLAIVQFGLSGTAAMLAIWLSVPTRFGGGLDRVTMRWDARNRATIALDAILIIAAGAFLITPLLMILVRGFPGLWDLPTAVWGAAARSILVALVSAALCLAMVFPWAIALDRLASRSIVSRGLEVSGYLAIAASPLVIGTGLFILLFPIADPFALALPVTALVNAVMSLPFALRILAPAVAEVEDTYGKLADSLGLKGWNRVRAVLLPRLRRQLGFSAGLAAALSMGDLGVIALFGDADRSTLPLMIYRLMSAYKMDAAMGAALLLLALSLALFWVFDRGGRIDADT